MTQDFLAWSLWTILILELMAIPLVLIFTTLRDSGKRDEEMTAGFERLRDG